MSTVCLRSGRDFLRQTRSKSISQNSSRWSTPRTKPITHSTERHLAFSNRSDSQRSKTELSTRTLAGQSQASFSFCQPPLHVGEMSPSILGRIREGVRTIFLGRAEQQSLQASRVVLPSTPSQCPDVTDPSNGRAIDEYRAESSVCLPREPTRSVHDTGIHPVATNEATCTPAVSSQSQANLPTSPARVRVTATLDSSANAFRTTSRAARQRLRRTARCRDLRAAANVGVVALDVLKVSSSDPGFSIDVEEACEIFDATAEELVPPPLHCSRVALGRPVSFREAGSATAGRSKECDGTQGPMLLTMHDLPYDMRACRGT